MLSATNFLVDSGQLGQQSPVDKLHQGEKQVAIVVNRDRGGQQLILARRDRVDGYRVKYRVAGQLLHEIVLVPYPNRQRGKGPMPVAVRSPSAPEELCKTVLEILQQQHPGLFTKAVRA